MPPAPTTLRNSNCRIIMGIMMGCPHLLQGTLPNGGKSPGIKTLVSHHPQVTIRSCSLMLWQQFTTVGPSDKPRKRILHNPKKPLTNPSNWCFFPAVEYEDHVD